MLSRFDEMVRGRYGQLNLPWMNGAGIDKIGNEYFTQPLAIIGSYTWEANAGSPLSRKEFPHYYLNSIGLTNVGLPNVPLHYFPEKAVSISSITGSIGYEQCLNYLQVRHNAIASGSGLPFVEIDLCPNIEVDVDVITQLKSVLDIVDRGKYTFPVAVKLPLLFDEKEIRDAAYCLSESRIDAVTMCNALPNAYYNGYFHSLSGPALKPLVLGMIVKMKNHLYGTNVIGCGGVQSISDVKDYLAVGCSLVQATSFLLTSEYESGDSELDWVEK